MSTREERIEVFQDTFNWVQSDPDLSSSIKAAKGKTEIFYEDIQIHTVWRQDVVGFAEIGGYAAYCVERFREWADKVNLTKTVAK